MQRATLPMAHYSLDSMQKKNFQRCDKFAADPVIIFVITGERFPRCPPKAASALNFNHGRKKLWSERRGGGLVITSANISSIFTKLIFFRNANARSCRCTVTERAKTSELPNKRERRFVTHSLVNHYNAQCVLCAVYFSRN